ncbi:mechanosensitive ion channel protein MscL [bacterium SCGC AG-212-C10]|nr:mechanosensitive ion channel protein MscL [bacterium SCGC AG-212-C10]
MKEFRDFILRGNVVDLAIAVVIGLAFGAMVSSFVENIITPLIAAIVGKPDFSNLSFSINESRFFYGSFLNAVISFVSIAAVIFFFVVKPMNLLLEKIRKGEAEPAPPPPGPTLSPAAEAFLAELTKVVQGMERKV